MADPALPSAGTPGEIARLDALAAFVREQRPAIIGDAFAGGKSAVVGAVLGKIEAIRASLASPPASPVITMTSAANPPTSREPGEIALLPKREPILDFQEWCSRYVKTLGRPLTQDEYFIAQAAFVAAHPSQGPLSSTMTEREPGEIAETLPQIIKDMQRASDMADAALSTPEYQVRLMALALLARQFLREVAEGRRVVVSPAPEQENP